MLRNKMHVGQNISQYHYCKYWDSHWLQTGCQKRKHNGPSPIYVPGYGILRNTREQVDCPGTERITIFKQRQLTKINQTTSDLPNRHLQIWHAIWYFMHNLCRRRLIPIWIQDWHQKRNRPLLRQLCQVWLQNAHWHKEKSLKIEWIFFLPAGFFSTITSLPTDLTNWTLALQKNKVKNRDTHVMTKDTPSENKHRSSKWKDDSTPSPITSST